MSAPKTDGLILVHLIQCEASGLRGSRDANCSIQEYLRHAAEESGAFSSNQDQGGPDCDISGSLGNSRLRFDHGRKSLPDLD